LKWIFCEIKQSGIAALEPAAELQSGQTMTFNYRMATALTLTIMSIKLPYVGYAGAGEQAKLSKDQIPQKFQELLAEESWLRD